jgi:hypothetical protein
MSCRRSAPTAQPGGLIATSLRADVTVSAAAAAAGDRRTRALASACPRQPRPDLAVSHSGPRRGGRPPAVVSCRGPTARGAVSPGGGTIPRRAGRLASGRVPTSSVSGRTVLPRERPSGWSDPSETREAPASRPPVSRGGRTITWPESQSGTGCRLALVSSQEHGQRGRCWSRRHQDDRPSRGRVAPRRCDRLVTNGPPWGAVTDPPRPTVCRALTYTLADNEEWPTTLGSTRRLVGSSPIGGATPQAVARQAFRASAGERVGPPRPRRWYPLPATGGT